MNGTLPKFDLRKYFTYDFQHTKAPVTNHEFHAIQTISAQPLEETDPAGLLLHALCSAKNLTLSVLIDHNCYQNSYILKLSSPVAAQINPLHIDIWIAFVLQRAIPPILNMNICFLVRLIDDRGGAFAA